MTWVAAFFAALSFVLYFAGLLMAAGITQLFSKERTKDWRAAFFWPLWIILAIGAEDRGGPSAKD